MLMDFFKNPHISLKPGQFENCKQWVFFNLFEVKSHFYLKENFKRKYCK